MILAAAITCFLLGSLWTAWVMQRSINRQSIFPARPQKAKVYRPTSYELEKEQKAQVERVKRLKERDQSKWLST